MSVPFAWWPSVSTLGLVIGAASACGNRSLPATVPPHPFGQRALNASSKPPPSKPPAVASASSTTAIEKSAPPPSVEPGVLAPPTSSSPGPEGPLGGNPPAPVEAPEGPFREPVDEGVKANPPRANRWARLTPASCRAELRRLRIPVANAGIASPGVATPLRLGGSLEGIQYHVPGHQSVYGILDCRLALVLRDFSTLLKKHGVSAVWVDNMYRPHAHLAPGKPSQHSYGLAIDIQGFVLESGKSLEVERDWHGAIGTPWCGPDAYFDDPSDAAILLRNLTCDALRAGLFHDVLTPNYDIAHRNHLHLDIRQPRSKSVAPRTPPRGGMRRVPSRIPRLPMSR